MQVPLEQHSARTGGEFRSEWKSQGMHMENERILSPRMTRERILCKGYPEKDICGMMVV